MSTLAAREDLADATAHFTDGRTARRERNRRAVLDAVLDLFAEGDLTPVPEAVAERSGVSLRSVYRFLSDTDDLVRAAIDRHLERVGHLFVFKGVGEGTFEERVRTLVDARLTLHQAIGPTARAAVARTRARPTPGSETLRRRLHARRGMLRLQLARHFEAELAGFGDQADAVLAVADGLTQIETIDWYLVDGGYSAEQTRDALHAGLRRLLGPGADVNAGREAPSGPAAMQTRLPAGVGEDPPERGVGVVDDAAAGGQRQP
jgi:TetR/AcrR family transcriptional regulator, regulator of autoinduction and epiphytic fitness